LDEETREIGDKRTHRSASEEKFSPLGPPLPPPPPPPSHATL